jgi:hypothetical protein
MPIFSRRIMIELENQGFEVIKTAPNEKYKGKTVYYFEETGVLRRALKALIKPTTDTTNTGCDFNEFCKSTKNQLNGIGENKTSV